MLTSGSQMAQELEVEKEYSATQGPVVLMRQANAFLTSYHWAVTS